jgi:cytochrome b subunit of formate dehydrogenase
MKIKNWSDDKAMKWFRSLTLWSRLIHWLMAIVLLVYLVTGLAIGYYQEMQVVTFGLLSKLLATKIHDALLVPFVILLLLHVVLVIVSGRRKRIEP